MPMLRTIERPTYADLAARGRRAASRICCTRCTWEAKQATMIRWSLFVEDAVEDRADGLLGRGEARAPRRWWSR